MRRRVFRACSRLRSRFCFARSSWDKVARRAFFAALSQDDADDEEAAAIAIAELEEGGESGQGVGLHAVTQFCDVKAVMWAVLVSIFSLLGFAEVGFRSIELSDEVEVAFWMRHDTAADATSLKSASVAADFGPVVDDVVIAEGATMGLFPPSLEALTSAVLLVAGAAVIENVGEIFL